MRSIPQRDLRRIRHRRTSLRNLFSRSSLAVSLDISVSGFSHTCLALLTPILAASLCNTASYVDIKAKTDTYVGFLPAHALERLLEKRPIVLLTLAKRLISLLSPLGIPALRCTIVRTDKLFSLAHRWLLRLGTGERWSGFVATRRYQRQLLHCDQRPSTSYLREGQRRHQHHC